MKCYSEIAVWRKMCWSTYKKLQLIWKYCQNVEQQQHYSVYCSLSASKKFLWTIVKAFTRHYSSWCTWERDDIQYFFGGGLKIFFYVKILTWSWVGGDDVVLTLTFSLEKMIFPKSISWLMKLSHAWKFISNPFLIDK